jgi:hypothetical protein
MEEELGPFDLKKGLEIVVGTSELAYTMVILCPI